MMDFACCLESVQENADNVYCFLFCDDALLIKSQEGSVDIPVIADIKTLDPMPAGARYIGELAGKACFAANLNAAMPPANIPAKFSFVKIRQLFGQLDDEVYRYALRALHITRWLRNNRYCGRCGKSMGASSEELALKCAHCGYTVYPRISPAIIVAIIKDDKILLARSNRFPAGRYSVIAGFVEPGETLEECVQREVREEVGIEVQAIRYFDNQPWPFPDSLMIGFIARYAGGELAIDNQEIVAAGWFSAGNLPEIPPKDSIARRLIDWFIDCHRP